MNQNPFADGLNWVQVYGLVASAIALLSMGAAFFIGVMNLTEAIASPLKRAGRPILPEKRLFWALLCLIAFYLASLATPPSGPQDTWEARGFLLASLVVLVSAALPAWRFAFLANEDSRPHPPFGPKAFFGFLGAMVAWNAVFLAFMPHFELPDTPLKHANLENPYLLHLVGGVALVAPIVEEVMYRGTLQPLLCKWLRSNLGGVLAAGFLWALGHSGMVDPPGFKEFQIMGLALAFGYARLHFGLHASILLHLVNNAMAMILQWLVLHGQDAGLLPPL